MEMISIAICDDEALFCCQMAEKIRRHLGKMGVAFEVHLFYHGRELLQAKEHFDIVLLDILMDEPDGMKTAEMLRAKTEDTLLIFITSSRKYVYDAYDVEAYQYLVKPVSDEKLFEVLERAVQKKLPQEQGFLVFRKGKTGVKIRLEDIYYLESQGRQLFVHTAEGVFSFYEKMGEMEQKLSEKGFCRCHKSYLISLRYVHGYNAREVIMDSGERIAIAKRRQEEFRKEMLDYMREKGGVL